MFTSILNEEYSWHDVRYQINSRISYDVDLCFIGDPKKELLPQSTILYRLDFPIVIGIFAKAWWMREEVFLRLFNAADDSSALRREWQAGLALSKPSKGKEGPSGGRTGEAAARTMIVSIITTLPVFAWSGLASPLFNKSGGEEQIYLPNLARGSGPASSAYARLLRTYTLPA